MVTEKSMEARAVAVEVVIEKHFLKYTVQHIQKYFEKLFFKLNMTKRNCVTIGHCRVTEKSMEATAGSGSTLKLLPTLMAPLKPPTH